MCKFQIEKKKLIEIIKQNKRNVDKLSYNFKIKFKIFQKRRDKRLHKNAMFEKLIVSMKQREKHFAKINNHEYVYNVLIKHLILNEKSIK